ncbi:3-oxoacyl-ACP reductase [Leucobacter chinensis]|uniref:3-oxoacyl-ACP reductase n=1 Tax=Leucobacter chinensis TaxID=2851010 RepID=UPI0020B870D7|nr:3-oxoacyl-ACP reductase [Leucobacter chinensis]
MTEPTPNAMPQPEPEPIEREMPVSQPVFVKALKWSVVATVLMIIVFGLIGWLVSEERGLIGGVLGAAGAGVFFALTLGSIAFANRFVESDLYVPMFFGIVVGGWLLKFVLFIVAALLLKSQPWLDPTILFIAVIVGVLVSLAIDAFVVLKSRIPLVSGR